MSKRMDLTVYVTADMSRGVLIFPAHPFLRSYASTVVEECEV
jgi:hypothetical protein